MKHQTATYNFSILQKIQNNRYNYLLERITDITEAKLNSIWEKKKLECPHSTENTKSTFGSLLRSKI
jgi:hypothetical protein